MKRQHQLKHFISVRNITGRFLSHQYLAETVAKSRAMVTLICLDIHKIPENSRSFDESD